MASTKSGFQIEAFKIALCTNQIDEERILANLWASL